MHGRAYEILVLRPPSSFVLSPGEKEQQSLVSDFADERPANPVVRIFNGTADVSPSSRIAGPGRGGM
jgi:hypothetical protein